MKVWSTRNQHMVFQVLDGRSNAYVISNGSSYIIVDTGVRRQWASLNGALEALGIKDDAIAGLILTHAHFDHVENAAQLKQKYGMPVFIHKNEAAALQTGQTSEVAGSLIITKWFTDKLASRPGIRFPYTPVCPDEIIDEHRDLGDLGFRAYIVHTPGHSPGSVSLIIDNEIAIVGDCMWGMFANSLFPPFANDPRQLIKSWESLAAAGCELYLPGHGSERTSALLKQQLKRFQYIYGLEAPAPNETDGADS